jgi:hypothetical protein
MRIMGTITRSTSLGTIKEMAKGDFDVDLTTEQARQIREAVKTGCLVWDQERGIRTTDNSRLHINPNPTE